MPASVHRTRLLSWTLPQLGWDVSVLTAAKELQRPEWVDAQGYVFFPPDAEVHEVEASGDAWWTKLGVGSIGWRTFLPFYRRGCELLSARRYDLVYISTTQFNLFCLGPLWKKHCGVPYVLDFHDPWYRPGERITTGGARWKSAVGNSISRFMERYAVSNAAGIVSVSPEYLRILCERYPDAPCFQNGIAATIPFGVREEDFAAAGSAATAKRDAKDVFDVVYVGVGAEIMAKSFKAIAESMARLRQEGDPLVERLRIHLSGTDGRWCNGRKKILRDIAIEAGVGDLVAEEPAIVPYREALARASNANGLLVLGVDDSAYMPSKLFLYASSKKPLLASMRHDSQVNAYFARSADLGRLMSFGAAKKESRNDEALRSFLQDLVEQRVFNRSEVRREFSALKMAEKHAELFKRLNAGLAG